LLPAEPKLPLDAKKLPLDAKKLPLAKLHGLVVCGDDSFLACC
jgi:hypothetical protein